MPRAVLTALLLTSAACHEPSAVKAEPSPEELKRKLAGLKVGEEMEMGDGVFMKLERVAATEPLGAGWNLAHSTEGGFTVEVPLPFNDFRMRMDTTDHVEMRTFAIGGKSPGLLSYAATCNARRDGTLGPKGRVPTPDTIEALGTPIKAYSRGVEFDDMACMLIVEAQGADPLPPEADRLRFLNSLKRTGKPTW